MNNSAFYESSPYKPRGLAYIDLIKKWYEWAQSIKREENPAIDTPIQIIVYKYARE
jgi:hypothetical protein